MSYLIVIGAFLVIFGILGSLLPTLPGPTLSFVGLLLLFFAKGSEVITVSTLVLFGIATVLLIGLDYIAPIIGAKYFGATKYGIIGAIIGLIVGIAVFFPLGILIGPFIGALIGEMTGGKKVAVAAQAGIGTIFGSVAMTALQTVFSIVVAIYFFIKVF